jgi:uncharacterized membrane protein YtjA (UPF0391 family)
MGHSTTHLVPSCSKTVTKAINTDEIEHLSSVKIHNWPWNINVASAFPEHLILEGDIRMLSWTLTFLVIALVAGALGFRGLSATSANIARLLFGLFLILFVVSLVMQVATPV